MFIFLHKSSKDSSIISVNGLHVGASENVLSHFYFIQIDFLVPRTRPDLCEKECHLVSSHQRFISTISASTKNVRQVKISFFPFYFGTKMTYKKSAKILQIFCNKIAQNMEFNVTRVTYQTMHLHPKIYFQPCPSNTSVLIVSPEFAYEKDRHVAIFSLSSSVERPRRRH